MAQSRPRKLDLHSRTQSADSIRNFLVPAEASMLFSLLPTAVQARIPRLPSIRRSVGTFPLTRRKISSSLPGSGARTPEHGYTSAMVLSRPEGDGKEDEITSYFGGSISEEEEEEEEDGMQIGTASPMADAGQRNGLTESNTGISWKFANQGLHLLSLSVNESSVISQDDGFENASFARQLYIHALTYLLRALPADLTAEEQLSLRSSLPVGVVESMGRSLPNGGQASIKLPSQQPSLLHRTLATTIIQLFIFFQLIFPYVKTFLQTAYRYDREHKISEKVLTQSINTVDGIGKRGLTITGAIYGMGDGKVGQAITETVAWVVEGVTGGIHEGVGEGMAMMGARRASSVEGK